VLKVSRRSASILPHAVVLRSRLLFVKRLLRNETAIDRLQQDASSFYAACSSRTTGGRQDFTRVYCLLMLRARNCVGDAHCSHDTNVYLRMYLRIILRLSPFLFLQSALHVTGFFFLAVVRFTWQRRRPTAQPPYLEGQGIGLRLMSPQDPPGKALGRPSRHASLHTSNTYLGKGGHTTVGGVY
jgi:hypothetical protein